ncbi:ISC system 2Fe-2S type ferredoxin [Burkholderiaceae bacterium FT117]|uniref:ISC system 2Fe-2S type ferredoxin n=1 Tax=Zeimonas sediminis TaxID=2944268 RepID=UPI002342DDBB|nr:ISC system 2Fe-2S type ferredoxin [Zeimonas sediminis]MCM5568904.1 ISC system 2Fe-2S type ferredoxin [Zeimonas sediminis]
MPRITVLPHEALCPQGAEFDAEPGAVLCRELLDHGIAIEHACELSCACTTCHVVVKQGFASLDASEEEEDDMLDKAWGLTAQSRLSCQVRVKAADLTIEIPKYTINHAREEH